MDGLQGEQQGNLVSKENQWDLVGVKKAGGGGTKTKKIRGLDLREGEGGEDGRKGRGRKN